jgi:hypothetical protein
VRSLDPPVRRRLLLRKLRHEEDHLLVDPQPAFFEGPVRDGAFVSFDGDETAGEVQEVERAYFGADDEAGFDRASRRVDQHGASFSRRGVAYHGVLPAQPRRP